MKASEYFLLFTVVVFAPHLPLSAAVAVGWVCIVLSVGWRVAEATVPNVFKKER